MPYAMRTSIRKGMFETANPVLPCGLIDGMDPRMPFVGLGSLGLTEATSKPAVTGVCAGVCARSAVTPMPETRMPQRTRTIVLIRCFLLARGRESSSAEVAGRERAFHRILVLDRPRVLQLDLRALHACGDDELDGLTFDRARQLGLSHQLRRVLTGQLLTVLGERQGWVALARRGLDGECPHASHIHFRCLAGAQV